MCKVPSSQDMKALLMQWHSFNKMGKMLKNAPGNGHRLVFSPLCTAHVERFNDHFRISTHLLKIKYIYSESHVIYYFNDFLNIFYSNDHFKQLYFTSFC
jgi:hypothetical protein